MNSKIESDQKYVGQTVIKSKLPSEKKKVALLEKDDKQLKTAFFKVKTETGLVELPKKKRYSWPKGVSGNPLGAPRRPEIELFRQALRKVEKEKDKSLLMHAVERAYVEDNVLVALLKKILPDKIEDESVKNFVRTILVVPQMQTAKIEDKSKNVIDAQEIFVPKQIENQNHESIRVLETDSQKTDKK